MDFEKAETRMESSKPSLDMVEIGLTFDQIDSNPRYLSAADCEGCLTDNTNATAQRPSACLACG